MNEIFGGDEVEEDVQRRFEERNELMRIAAQSLLDHHRAGRKADPHALEWARRIVAQFKPLGRPLGEG